MLCEVEANHLFANSTMHGQFCWYELTTPDVDASMKFYPRFTGWGTQKFDNDYTMWTTGGVPFAGIFRLKDDMRQQGVPPNWMPYVESDDVDGTVTRAMALGGKVVVNPTNVSDAGRFAVLSDPQGAVFGVYKSNAGSTGWNGTAVVGRMSWHELMTTDNAAAYAFYSALFGWNKTGEMDMGGGNMYTMFGKGQAMYGGIYNRTPEMAGMHPFWLCYIHVKDVGKAVDIATRAGATVHRPRMEIPGGTIAVLGDPQGAGFALHDVSAAVMPDKPAAKPAAKAAPKPAAKSAAKAVAKKAKPAAKKAKPAAKKSARRAARKAVRAPARRAAKARPKKAVRTKPKGKAKAKPRSRARRSAKSAPRRRPPTKSRRSGKARARKK